MTLQEYFALPEAPATNSPIGKLMLVILDKFSGVAVEEARTRANALLAIAAGKRVYRVPPVLTDEAQESRRAATRARFATRSETPPKTPVNRISSVGGPKKTLREGYTARATPEKAFLPRGAEALP